MGFSVRNCLVLAALVSLSTTILSDPTALAQESPKASDSSAVPGLSWKIARQNESDTPDGKVYTAVLQIPDLALCVPLMDCSANTLYNQGVDEETIRLEWLEPGKALWIRWCTLRMPGSGGYRTEAHVIMSTASSTPEELLRESFLEWGKQGIGNYVQTKAEYRSLNPGKDAISIRRTVTYDESSVPVDTALPLSLKSETVSQVRQFRIIEETVYRFGGPAAREGKYGFSEHRAWLDLVSLPLFDMEIPEYQNHEFSLQEIAEFLVLYLCPRYGQEPGVGACLPEERDKMMADLLRMNHGLAPDKGIRAKIEIPLSGRRLVIRPLVPEDDYFPFR